MKKTDIIPTITALICIFSMITAVYASTGVEITSSKSSFTQGKTATFEIIYEADSEADNGYCSITYANLTFENGKTTQCEIQATRDIPSTATRCGFTVTAVQTECTAYGSGSNITYGNQVNYTVTGKIPSTWGAGSYTATVYVVSAETYSDSVSFTVESSTTTTTRASSSGSSGGSSGGAPRSGGGINQPAESCFDGLKNQDEEGVDCGGTCQPCASCSDGIQNQGEEGIDCGGPCKECQTATTTTIEAKQTTSTQTTIKKTTTMKQTTSTTEKKKDLTTSTQEITSTSIPPSTTTTPLGFSMIAIAAIGLILVFVIYRTMNR
ncbi:MAG: hypothetical protein B6U97_04200 [Candidatus Altiarchaeales archaeon ex4484_96]|nr:MAG: hypothetical protein B6U97_04200 [Candidatus Altiarchaeales archaeon ex4484_96]